MYAINAASRSAAGINQWNGHHCGWGVALDRSSVEISRQKERINITFDELLLS